MSEYHVRRKKKEHPQANPEMRSSLQGMPAYFSRVTIPDESRVWIGKHN